MLSLNVNTLDIKKQLEAVSDKAKKSSVYAGAQAAAEVIYKEAKVRVPVQSGKLRDSIYQVQSKDNSTDTKAVYHVAWNHRKAPHGHLIEFGTSRAPAHPFLRPAYEATKQEAIQAGIDAFKKDLGLK